MRADSGRPYPDWVSVEWLASLRAHQRLWPACEDSATPEKCNNVRHSYAKPTRAEIESTRRAVKKLVLAQDGVVECARGAQQRHQYTSASPGRSASIPTTDTRAG